MTGAEKVVLSFHAVTNAFFSLSCLLFPVHNNNNNNDNSNIGGVPQLFSAVWCDRGQRGHARPRNTETSGIWLRDV